MGEAHEEQLLGPVPLGLDEHLCFALYSASRAIVAAERPGLRELGLTYPQYLVMLVTWQSAGPVTVSQLGQRLDLDSGTLSPLLKRLEALGFVTRIRSADDERSVLISLTPAGRALKDRAGCVGASFAEGMSLGDTRSMSADELVDLRETLHRLTDILRRNIIRK